MRRLRLSSPRTRYKRYSRYCVDTGPGWGRQIPPQRAKSDSMSHGGKRIGAGRKPLVKAAVFRIGLETHQAYLDEQERLLVLAIEEYYETAGAKRRVSRIGAAQKRNRGHVQSV